MSNEPDEVTRIDQVDHAIFLLLKAKTVAMFSWRKQYFEDAMKYINENNLLMENDYISNLAKRTEDKLKKEEAKGNYWETITHRETPKDEDVAMFEEKLKGIFKR